MTPPAPFASATATATVFVVNPALSAVKSVGLAADACAPAGPLTAPISALIYYCITLRNTGDVTLTDHVISDPRLGIIDAPVSYSLAPGASVAITRSVLPPLGPIVMTAALTNAISITSTATVSEVGGILVPAVGVQTQGAGEVSVIPQPTNLDPDAEPLDYSKRLYLPHVQR